MEKCPIHRHSHRIPIKVTSIYFPSKKKNEPKTKRKQSDLGKPLD